MLEVNHRRSTEHSSNNSRRNNKTITIGSSSSSRRNKSAAHSKRNKDVAHSRKKSARLNLSKCENSESNEKLKLALIMSVLKQWSESARWIAWWPKN